MEKNQIVSNQVYNVATQKTYCAASYAIVVAEAITALKARLEGSIEPLSPQQLLDCTSDFDIMQLKVKADKVNAGCEGGYVLPTL